MRENSIELYLKSQVAEHGGLAKPQTAPGTRGWPDDIVIWPPVTEGMPATLHFVELKQLNGRLEKTQIYWLNMLTSMGCTCYALYGKEGVDDYINGKAVQWTWQPAMP